MILDQKEKILMNFFYQNCNEKTTKLFSSQELVKFVAEKKHALSLNELDNIMNYLQKENYIDFVASDSKKGVMYCVSLKQKGKLFKKDLENEKKQARMLIARTIGLAILSFLVGIILKAIFS